MQRINDQEWLALKKKLMRSKRVEAIDLGEPEIDYIRSRGTDILRLHASDFIRKRIAPATPKNDGRQTPRKGHPVFIAQHATGTSDRSLLKRFHGIPVGVDLTDHQIEYVVDVVLRWIDEQTALLAD